MIQISNFRRAKAVMTVLALWIGCITLMSTIRLEQPAVLVMHAAIISLLPILSFVPSAW